MKNLNFPGMPRILVIDDEEGVREGLRTLLQTEGVAVETAATAEDALRRLEQKPFDVMFLDLNLPGADGLSILPSLRQGTPPADVVVLTGYGTVANTVEAMRKLYAEIEDEDPPQVGHKALDHGEVVGLGGPPSDEGVHQHQHGDAADDGGPPSPTTSP